MPMRRFVRPAIFALCVVPAAALAQDDAAQLKRGEALVRQHCAACHAVARDDASTHRQAPPFRALGRRYKIESLEEALAEGLSTGHPEMPEFKFEPDDVGAVVAYLKAIQVK
jgi:mono/diheme cytochrome c family protein